MDVLAFVLALLSGKKLPAATAADAGDVVQVDSNGDYVLAPAPSASVSVSNHALIFN